MDLRSQHLRKSRLLWSQLEIDREFEVYALHYSIKNCHYKWNIFGSVTLSAWRLLIVSSNAWTLTGISRNMYGANLISYLWEDLQLQLRLLVFFSFIHESPKGIFYRPTFSQLVILCAAVVFTSWLILVGLCCLLPLILISRIPNGTLPRAREPDTIAIHQAMRVAEEVNGTCVPFQNSAAWLQERLGNKASELTDENIYNLIELSSQLMSEKAFQTATSQTVCPSDSTFRKRIDPNENTWTFRLIYMAIHDLLHEPAMEEMRARRGCGFDNNNVGRFDYECPKTKFLVSFLHSGEAGLGALLRLQAVSIVLYALSLGRIPVFVNNLKDDGMQSIYWQIADIRRENHFNKSVGLMDCERGDLQCFFLPLSPCTITMEELRKAFVRSERRAYHCCSRLLNRWLARKHSRIGTYYL